MREFNTFGPVNPAIHYHINRVAVKDQIKQKIDKGRYFTLNAARQTGKTTIFHEVTAELETEKHYFSILLNFETLRGYNRTEFYYWLKQKLIEYWQAAFNTNTTILSWLKSYDLKEQNGFGQLLRYITQELNQPGILIIDEFDAIGSELAEPLLSVFREMYLNQHNPSFNALKSIILVGVRNIPALLGGSQSPFNIADQYEVPYFTKTECTDLLIQHTAETGQAFEQDVIEAIYQQSEGQPFLINRLANILSVDLVPDYRQAITWSHFKRALDMLLKENNTHFASITSKATPHRKTLLPILFYNERRSNFRNPTTNELLMYGILRVVNDEAGFQTARIANPIYRKVLILTFSPEEGETLANGNNYHRYAIEGLLDMEGLLKAFKKMMEEHGVRLLRSKKTLRPLEIGGQYLLLSYLTAALDSVGGHISLESINSAGEIDLLVLYKQTQFIIETKLWYGKKHFEEGQGQLANYLTAAKLNKGYMVLFSQKELIAKLGDEAKDCFEVIKNEKTLFVCPVFIGENN